MKLHIATLAVAAVMIVASCYPEPERYYPDRGDRVDNYKKTLIADHVVSLGVPEPDYTHVSRVPIDSAAISNKLSEYYLKARYIQGQSDSYFFGEEESVNPFKDSNITGVGYPDLNTFAHIWVDGLKHVAFNASFINFDLFVMIPIGVIDGVPAYTVYPNYVFENLDVDLTGFVISISHDSFHLQVPGGSLGLIPIYYCEGNDCTPLTDYNGISEYLVEVLDTDGALYEETDLFGEEGFGNFRIYASDTEGPADEGYTPRCTLDKFSVRVSSPDAEGYTQCGEIKLDEINFTGSDFTPGSCGDCIDE